MPLLRLIAFISPILTLVLYLQSHPSDSAWYETQGYGYVIEMTDNQIKLFDRTRISLIPFASGKLDTDGSFNIHQNNNNSGKISGYFSPKHAPSGNAHLELEDSVYKVTPLDKPPKVKYSETSLDPVINFEVFWQTLEEQSIAFNHRSEVDWKHLKKRWQNKISHNTHDSELLKYFGEMIAILNDGHTTLSGAGTELESKKAGEFETYLSAKKKYVKRHLRYIQHQLDEPITKKRKKILYGFLEDAPNVAYLNLRTFEGFTTRNNNIAKELKAFRKPLTKALQHLQSSSSLILDLRFNTGGYDALAQELIRHFLKHPQTVYHKQYRSGNYNEFGALQDIVLKPAPDTYQGKLFILIGPVTASAAEVAVLGLNSQADTTLIGEPSNGSFSDTLHKTLPNGWLLTLSNERYLDIHHKDQEQIGIKPDYFVEFTVRDIEKGRDPVLEKAIQLADAK